MLPRALAALKQWDQALDLIAVDDAPDTRRLRADIYWESGNWAIAGQKAEQAVDISFLAGVLGLFDQVGDGALGRGRLPAAGRQRHRGQDQQREEQEGGGEPNWRGVE